ncbi:AMP-binding protein [Aeromicrobium sp. REDSEA-S32_B7]|uniref:AMP-binding protein n=1 Tax=Aeromicrobium sp. REDSEA-S32_B7 TaxID=1811526 RepID=UPI000ADA686F|nr:AMP-binding protein [Aeromicrobium sp. REDSEA-S32_B7]
MTDLPIGRAFAVLAERSPDAVAVHDGDDVWTRRRLEDDTNRLARAWQDRVGLDDVVTVALPSGIDLVRACVAAWKLGATPQPLAPTLDVAERQAVLDLTGPALVVDGRLGETSTVRSRRSCRGTPCSSSRARCSTPHPSCTPCAAS